MKEKNPMVRSLTIGLMSFAVTATIIVGSMQGSAAIG